MQAFFTSVKYFCVLLLTVTAGNLYAQSYTFNGSGYWSAASNWLRNAVPPSPLPAGDTIYIAPAAGDSCVLDVSQSITRGAYLIVAGNARFIVHGRLDIRDLFPALTTCLPPNLQTDVIAFYPFNNGSLKDYSGHQYDLTNMGAETGEDRAGNPDGAYSFRISDFNYLQYTNPVFLDDFQTRPFSVSLWYKNLLTGGGTYELLIGRGSGLHCPDTYGEWSVGLYNLRNPVFGINQYSDWYELNDTSRAWKHLVVTNSGRDMKIYINGVLSSYTPQGDCGPVTENTGDLLLGQWFTGSIDDVIIYGRVLDASEIAQLYSLPACHQ
jgi:hypothetical protein